jgi:ParB family chromosome partitioning protein
LTAHRTAALRAMLAENADAALTAVVHALALPVFYDTCRRETCLELRLGSATLHADGIEESPAMQALADWESRWRQELPEDAAGLWDWLLVQDTATRLGILAYCAACSVNAVVKPHERSEERLAHADGLALALGLDMTRWWQPTASTYLRRVSKSRILEAVTEADSPEAAGNFLKLKKDALVQHAEERLAGTGWLPTLLRARRKPCPKQQASPRKPPPPPPSLPRRMPGGGGFSLSALARGYRSAPPKLTRRRLL